MKKIKIEDKIFLFLVILIAAGGFIKPIIDPVDVNTAENRTANRLPAISISALLDKTYQDGLEKAYADQIPLTNRMKVAKNTFSVFAKVLYYKTFSKEVYNNLGPSYLVEDYLLYTQEGFDYYKEITDQKIASINKLAEQFPDKEVYIYYIEKDSDINFIDNNKLGVFEYIENNLQPSIGASKFEINNFEEYKKYFYKTDHHWDYRGADKAYNELLELLGIEEESIKPNKEICINSILNGSKGRYLGGVQYFKEQFCAYEYNIPNHDVYISNNLYESYGEYKKLKENNPKEVTYGDWYGWDNGFLTLDYKNESKQNLLMLGNSYDNAINELLASHFNKTYNIDLRNYEYDMKEKFNITKFVEENNIDKILFIGNMDFYGTSEFLLPDGGEQ